MYTGCNPLSQATSTATGAMPRSSCSPRGRSRPTTPTGSTVRSPNPNPKLYPRSLTLTPTLTVALTLTLTLPGALNWEPSLDLPGAARDAAATALATLGVCYAQDGTWDTVRDEDVELAWAQHLQRTEAAEVSLLVGALETPSLAGAQRIARERHLLRAAVERQLARAPEQRPAKRPAKRKPAHRGGAVVAAAEMDGGRSGGARSGLSRLVGAMVRDAAEGRTLLNSDALAAAEVARQLRLPLSVMASRAPAAERHGTSWYTQAHMRLAELERRLVSAKVALRSRVASEGGAAALAVGEDAEALRWATSAAGVRLTQPTPLQTAYGLHAPPTHVVPRYANTLDWICIDAQRLDVVSVAPRPPLQVLTRDVAMPSAEWPSDHVSLCCDLAWRT